MDKVFGIILDNKWITDKHNDIISFTGEYEAWDYVTELECGDDWEIVELYN